MQMKVGMCGIFYCFFLTGQAQLRSAFTPFEKIEYDKNFALSSSRFNESKLKYHRATSPRLTQTTPTSGDRRSTNYWTSNVTMQSYGKGKWGTYYYWDVQGNLREMQGFVDIAGKNKRGLKLVFPWR